MAPGVASNGEQAAALVTHVSAIDVGSAAAAEAPAANTTADTAGSAGPTAAHVQQDVTASLAADGSAAAPAEAAAQPEARTSAAAVVQAYDAASTAAAAAAAGPGSPSHTLAAAAAPPVPAAAAVAGPKPPLLAPAPTPPASQHARNVHHAQHTQHAQHAQHAQRVVLRVQVATKGLARLLTWSVISANIAFICVAATLYAIRSQKAVTKGWLRELYDAKMVLGAVCLGGLAFMAVWFAHQVRQTQREQRIWSNRQLYFSRTVGVLLALQIVYCSLYVTSYGATLAQPDCGYPWHTVVVLDFCQNVLVSAELLFLLSRLKGVTLWRGPGALDMPPDARLQCDLPLCVQTKALWPFYAWFCLLIVGSGLTMVSKMHRYAGSGPAGYGGDCEARVQPGQCDHSAEHVVAVAITFALAVGVVIVWYLLVQRGLREHENLPYCRYKSTHIFVRVQAWLVTPVLTAVILSMLLLATIPTLQDRCSTAGDSQIGNLTINLSLSLVAAALAFLYMPAASSLDNPLQELQHDVSWTLASVAADTERRNTRLATLLEERPYKLKGRRQQAEAAVVDAVAFLPGRAMAGIARVLGVPNASEAVARLDEEPMFCMETAIRLFYWSRLVYEDSRGGPFHNEQYALSLFGLQQVQEIVDPATDTHSLIGTSPRGSAQPQAVVSFRGTSSMQNILTDLEMHKIKLPAAAFHNLHLTHRMQIHSGFAKAWLSGGLNQNVLARLAALAEAQPHGAPPLRFWITGHSLGGALAVLASLAIKQLFPDSDLTVYTFGAPRVGNNSFAAHLDKLVPDMWAVMNGKDPVPWVPKHGFKRSGKRVTVDASGNLILRPSYFELSVMERGTATKHHLTTSYALSMAAVLKAQFAASKALPGGAEGVQALADAVDLGRTLLLTNMDLESLRDPEKVPQCADELAAQQQRAALRRLPSLANLCGPSVPCFGCVGGSRGVAYQQGVQRGAGRRDEEQAEQRQGRQQQERRQQGQQERRQQGQQEDQ